jgi:DNA-binding MarR family transcriptional regulator
MTGPADTTGTDGTHQPFTALMALARGIDHAHSSGVLLHRSGVRLDRGLHPVLATIGERGPLRTTELATALALKASTVSRHVARLEAMGLAEREADARDARASWIGLTPSGSEMLEALRTAWEQIITDRLRAAGFERPEAFVADLRRFGTALEQLSDEPPGGRG